MDAVTARRPDRQILDGSVILFDLDGTLVDTAPDLVRALNHALVKDGLPKAQLSDVRAMVGRGSRALILRALARCGTSYPEAKLQALQSDFLQAYAEGVAQDSVLFPHVRETLDVLKAAGAHMAVATNKPHGLAQAVLDAFNISDYFFNLVGGDTAPRKKPDGAHLVAAAAPHTLERAVMIGDSETDAAAAHAARVPVILVRHGYSETPLDLLKAHAIFDDFEDLPEAIAQALKHASACA